ncbi:hypothetical protein Tco_0941746 [Tanacetum coccineum]|uniref:Uncharacterized protein n=1 Tax=Tanacetum coccineum TaxID=301880 RepID=A0ABQ5DUB7_9ASTR
MGEPLSPDRVFDFPVDEPKSHPAYNFFAPGPLPGYAGNPNNNNGWIEADVPLLGDHRAVADEPMVDQIAEPIVEAEEQVIAPVVDMDEDIAMLFGDDGFEDDKSDGFDEEEVWEVNEEWLMAPTTPPPMPAVQPSGVYEVGGPSTVAAEGPSFPLPTPRLPIPPSVIEDLSTRLGNLEYGHGQLEQVGAQVEQGQQTAAQRDEVIAELTQQVQALQAAMQQRDSQIQQLSMTVTEMSSRESTLMQCILGMDGRLAELERRPPGPQFLRWVEAEMVSPEVEGEKWRRLLLHWMYDAFDVSTDGREEDFFPRNGMWWWYSCDANALNRSIGFDNPVRCMNPLLGVLQLPSSDPEIVSFIKELGYTGDIDSVTKVYTDHMPQPWRTFAVVINICLFRKTTGLDKIRLSRAQILFTKAIIQQFISKYKSISMRNKLFMHTVQDDSILGSLRFVSKDEEYQVYGALIPTRMTNRKMLNSTAYKTYLAFATGAATPKKARKFKKPASHSKKKTLVTVEEPNEKPAKKPAAKRQSVDVQIRDTPSVSVSKQKAPAKTERSKGIELLSEAALLKEARLEKAIKRSKRETNIHQAGGSSEGDGLEPEVPDEQKRKSTDTCEGTGLIPGVPNVSKADSSENEYESWGDSDDDNDDDDQQSDDEQNVSDNPRTSDDEEETQEDEFMHTPENYVPTDDENVDDEEYERINKEMYDDVNVELRDVETADEGKGDEEMADAEKVDAENEYVNQEVAGDQLNDDAQAIGTADLATQKTKVPLQSSSISSDYAVKFLNFDNIPSANTEIISMMDIKVQHEDPSKATISTTSVPDSSTLTAIHQRLSELENEVKTLRNVDHSSAIRATIKSEVPIVVKEYLGTSLNDTLHKVIQRHTAKLIKELSVLTDIIEVLQQQ